MWPGRRAFPPTHPVRQTWEMASFRLGILVICSSLEKCFALAFTNATVFFIVPYMLATRRIFEEDMRDTDRFSECLRQRTFTPS